MTRARELAELGSAYDSGALSNRNILKNGGQTVDQRNSGSAITLTSSHQYATDRFICRLGTSSSSTAQRVADAPDGLYNSVKITIGTGATPSAATATGYFAYKTEGLDTAHLKFGSSDAKTITLSFYVKSSLTGSFGVTVANDALNRSFPSSYTINSANTWERKSITVTGDTSGTWATTNAAAFYLLWDLGCGSDVKGTANTWAGADYRGGATGTTNVCATSSATWYITGVQMEIGTEATPFEVRSYSDEHHSCKRYYQKMVNPTYSANGGTNNYLQWWYVPEMRASPTLAGGIGGTNDTSNTVRAQHYASGSNYAYYDAGVTADAEL
tara:strand:+ start:78 stop:1061 length:984 start_codon:yes stop_codon:yes gene_type:complete